VLNSSQNGRELANIRISKKPEVTNSILAWMLNDEKEMEEVVKEG
jgi:hypothetical protein